MRTLDDFRKDIDRVDEVIVRLLNERARVACEIGRLKKAEGVPVYQPAKINAPAFVTQLRDEIRPDLLVSIANTDELSAAVAQPEL